jgi:glycosyltransferase involved in cell wall biosynthesis
VKLAINRIDISDHTGYGRATNSLTRALEKAGVDIVPSAPTVLNFCMPKHYVYGDYTIGYTPWESTKVPEDWIFGLHAVDELWSPSTWSSEILSSISQREVFTLPHGIDDVWMPVHHRYGYEDRPFTYLHVGEPAVRKGGDLVLAAWYEGLKDTHYFRLIYKCTGIPQARVKDRSGSIIFSPPMLENGTVINKLYSDLEMWRLYAEVDCLVYPTRGEGFGFIPLEAMASGLPTILPAGGGTDDFADYGIPLNEYEWKPSGEIEHPGDWMDHSVSEILDRMRSVRLRYTEQAERAYVNAIRLKEMYSWDKVAQLLINRLDGHL